MGYHSPVPVIPALHIPPFPFDRSGREDGEDSESYYNASDMSVEQSRVALSEVIELLEAAEAKVS